MGICGRVGSEPRFPHSILEGTAQPQRGAGLRKDFSQGSLQSLSHRLGRMGLRQIGRWVPLPLQHLRLCHCFRLMGLGCLGYISTKALQVCKAARPRSEGAGFGRGWGARRWGRGGAGRDLPQTRNYLKTSLFLLIFLNVSLLFKVWLAHAP